MKEGQESAATSFEPYVQPSSVMPEFTIRAVILGVLLGIVFGAANAYLGLKVGMTVSASIPVAVISMGILRGLMKRGTILENNMVQTIGSAGESLAAGIIFTVPALFIWGLSPSLSKIFVWALLGGVLGILFMIPLRRFLIVREHGRLPYPEGTACAEVLIAGEAGGSKAGMVFKGAGVGAVYKLLMNGFGLWKETPAWSVRVPKTVIGVDAVPALLGVGYIIGPRIAAYIFGGGALSWLVFIPLIASFGESILKPIFPASGAIAEMDAHDIWHNYIRYVGAGAVALGGLLSLIRAVPTIVRSFKLGFKEIVRPSDAEGMVERTQRDLPMKWVVIGAVGIALLMGFAPHIEVGIVGALLTVLFAFFFATVSSRLVGIVGSSSNPASGMTIATLLATTVIFVAVGYTGTAGMVAALSVGAIVCICIAIAGDTSQDLKTGFLVGATPRSQQIGEFIGVLTSALFVGLSVYLLNEAYGIGGAPTPEHPTPLAAPQATLMSMVISGVMNGNLPWTLVFIGAGTALLVELFGVSSLPFAVGLYLPMELSTPIIAGGLVRWAAERKTQRAETAKTKSENRGVLYASGLIAGEASMGVILAVLIWQNVTFNIAEGWMGRFADGGALLIFGLLAYSLWKVAENRRA